MFCVFFNTSWASAIFIMMVDGQGRFNGTGEWLDQS